MKRERSIQTLCRYFNLFGQIEIARSCKRNKTYKTSAAASAVQRTQHWRGRASDNMIIRKETPTWRAALLLPAAPTVTRLDKWAKRAARAACARKWNQRRELPKLEGGSGTRA